jgi:hypothetical protein
MGGCALDSFSSSSGPVAICCEHGNELSGSIKDAGNFLTSQATTRFSRTLLHGVSIVNGPQLQTNEMCRDLIHLNGGCQP